MEGVEDGAWRAWRMGRSGRGWSNCILFIFDAIIEVYFTSLHIGVGMENEEGSIRVDWYPWLDLDLLQGLVS